jgi:AcrR family transcriptional regulator
MQSTTPRALARQAQVARIKATARRLLSEQGAAGLSLRQVAREMNQSSSALYRYFPTRDDLLTALILDAYNELGQEAEQAEARVPRREFRLRWYAACRAIRAWAIAHPHEYALVFGSPIPGYHAPDETTVAASRITTLLARIVNDGYGGSGRPVDEVAEVDEAEVGRYLDLVNLRSVMPDVPAGVIVASIGAWTQVFGFLSFELFGHYKDSVLRAGPYFDEVLRSSADAVGLDGALDGAGHQ